MFKVINIVRLSAELVTVTVSMCSKEWCKTRAKGNLGQLYGIDISNTLYHEFGIRAYMPSVGDRERASSGVKTITLTYQDREWTPAPNNVIRVDFKGLSKQTVSTGGELLVVDFVNKKRAA